MIPIVLTGTILPNSIKIQHLDCKARRLEYLEAIRYYKQYSKVYFLENSDYDLLRDPEFAREEGFYPMKFKKSEGVEKGKGYQEFQKLDEFVCHDLAEDCFLKVTGRYIYRNFDKIFSFVNKNRYKYNLIIDALIRPRMAITGPFYVRRNTYMAQLQGLYHQMDDSRGICAEHVVYNSLRNIRKYTFFPTVPIFNAISGATGNRINTNENILKMVIKNAQRKLFMTLKVKQLLI